MRVRRRRSGRTAAVAVALLVATVSLSWWATQVRARGDGWMDTLPTWLYARALARGWDEPWHVSASRRLAEQPSLEEIATLRDASLELWSREWPHTEESWRLCMRTAASAVPTGEDGTRFIAAVVENVNVIAIPQDDRLIIELRPINKNSGEIRSLMVRVDEVRIGDRIVPFEIVSGNERLAREEATRLGVQRLWHSLMGIDRSGTLRLLVPGETLEGGGPERVKVSGQLAYPSELLDALQYDSVIASTRDPVEWGVRVAWAPFERLAMGPPGLPAPIRVDKARAWTADWWPDPSGYPMMPALAAVPIVAMALAGALAGFIIALALPCAFRAARGRVRLSPPTCRSCGAMVRGHGDGLPARCPECGLAIASIDDCRCVVQRWRWPLSVLVLIVAAAAGVWLVPHAWRRIGAEVSARFASPEREAAWLVRATIEARPAGMGPAPGNRLKYGAMDSAARTGWPQEHAANESASRELLAWWRETGGELPYSLRDADGGRRRLELATFLQQAVACGAMSAEDARPIAKWCGEVPLDPPDMSLPLWVRAGEPIKPLPRYTNSAEAVVSPSTGPRAWQWPQQLTLATPKQPGPVDVEVIWSRPVLVPGQTQPPPGRPTPVGPAPDGDPLFERVLRGRVQVVAADAPLAVTGPVLDELVPSMKIALRICETGTRSAVQLSSQPAGLGWLGRWEVLNPDVLDAANAPGAPPCAVMRRLPTGWNPATLGTFPSPLPEELFVRFVPELPESSYTSPGKFGFACGATLTFRVRRCGEEDYQYSRVVVYRSAE